VGTREAAENGLWTSAWDGAESDEEEGRRAEDGKDGPTDWGELRSLTLDCF